MMVERHKIRVMRIGDFVNFRESGHHGGIRKGQIESAAFPLGHTDSTVGVRCDTADMLTIKTDEWWFERKPSEVTLLKA